MQYAKSIFKLHLILSIYTCGWVDSGRRRKIVRQIHLSVDTFLHTNNNVSSFVPSAYIFMGFGDFLQRIAFIDN
jgi:hypothetical protein